MSLSSYPYPEFGEADLSVAHVPSGRIWQVVHACESIRPLLPLLDVEAQAGMKPFVVTPSGSAANGSWLQSQPEAPPASTLLTAWGEVRNWRKRLLEADPDRTADVVHAHSFASGMAAVRNCPVVVYDLDGCIEELAAAAGQCDPHSWIARSFRVAEQFILARAGAV